MQNGLEKHSVWDETWTAGLGKRCSVTESQLPHKTDNFVFLVFIVNNKLTMLWES